MGAADENWAGVTNIISIQVVVAGDSQFLHFVLQGSALQTNPGRRAFRTRKHAPGLTQNFDDVIALPIAQRPFQIGKASHRLLAQLRQRWTQPVVFRQNYRTLDEILQFADVPWPDRKSTRLNSSH